MNEPMYPIIIGLIAALIVYLQIRKQLVKRQVAQALTQGAKVIDVRSPAEYAQGHYPGSVNIPVDKLTSRLKSIGATNQTIIVYCASGARSAMASRTLKASGYARVLNAGTQAALPEPAGN